MGMLETAKMDGLDIGIEKGIEKGSENTVIQIFNKGKSINFITDILDLSEREVMEILKKAKLL